MLMLLKPAMFPGLFHQVPSIPKKMCLAGLTLMAASAVEAIGRVYCPIAWLPPGHDPDASGGVATSARQRGFGLGTFWIDNATPGWRRRIADAAWLAR